VRFRYCMLALSVCLVSPSLLFAQQMSNVQLQANHAIFAVVTAMNACGYDEGLNTSDPVREQVRNQVKEEIERFSAAKASKEQMCQFYRDHQPSDPNRDLSQYISLALSLGGPPDFKPKLKEADLPPDAAYVLGFVPLVAHFYQDADLQKILDKVIPHYVELVDKFNAPMSQMILQTDVYLKIPISGYKGQQLVIFVEPMAAPGQVNARNYGDNYYVVTAPVNGQLPIEQVRHTYLHFVLDPMANQHPAAMKRLSPLLKTVQNAPLSNEYKDDISLLVTESLIRAIEARLMTGGHAADPRREQLVERDMTEGFILTRYFYNELIKFEPEATSLKEAFTDFLYDLDVGREAKLASQIHFASEASEEVVKVKSKSQPQLSEIEMAQQKLAANDLDTAQKLAQEVASKNGPDAPRAYFVLGEIATLHKDPENAIKYFEQTLQTAKEPQLIAWSHIYLGRIYDVDQERDMAVKHYQAALRAGDDTPQTKAAAENGLKAPYERHAPTEQQQ
jgi:Tetratricopeptide repeat